MTNSLKNLMLPLLLGLIAVGCTDVSTPKEPATSGVAEVERTPLKAPVCRTSKGCNDGEVCVMINAYRGTCQPGTDLAPQETATGRTVPPMGLLEGDALRQHTSGK